MVATITNHTVTIDTLCDRCRRSESFRDALNQPRSADDTVDGHVVIGETSMRVWNHRLQLIRIEHRILVWGATETGAWNAQAFYSAWCHAKVRNPTAAGLAAARRVRQWYEW